MPYMRRSPISLAVETTADAVFSAVCTANGCRHQHSTLTNAKQEDGDDCISASVHLVGVDKEGSQTKMSVESWAYAQNPTNTAINIIEIPQSQLSNSPPPANEVHAIAYAATSHEGPGYYKLGKGLAGIYKGCEQGYLSALNGFAHDIVAHLKGLFVREDPWGDLRGRGQIIVTVEETRTVTIVRKT